MSLSTSKRQAALDDLLNRLSFIQVAKGYNTDAGLYVLQGESPKFGEDDPKMALSVSIGDDSPSISGGKVRTTVPFQVWALVPVGTLKPLEVIEKMIADIREAVEIEADGSVDRYLGTLDGSSPATLPKGLERGVTRGLTREEGSNYVGAACEYVATFEDSWGTQ